jgi:hypothetical protein
MSIFAITERNVAAYLGKAVPQRYARTRHATPAQSSEHHLKSVSPVLPEHKWSFACSVSSSHLNLDLKIRTGSAIPSTYSQCFNHMMA